MRRRRVVQAGISAALAAGSGCVSRMIGGESPRIRWELSLPLSESPPSRATLNKGALFIDTKTSVVAVDPESAEQRWRIKQSALAGHYNQIVFTADEAGTDGRTVSAIPAAGVVAWTTPGRYLHGSGSSIYVLGGATTDTDTPDGLTIKSLEPDSGTIQWTHPLDRQVHSQMNLRAPGLVYAVYRPREDSAEARVRAIDPGTGNQRWISNIGPAGATVVREGMGGLIIGTRAPTDEHDATVTAVTPTGEIRWRRRWNRSFALPRWAGATGAIVEVSTAGKRPPETVMLGDLTPSDTRWRRPGQFITARNARDHVAVLGDGHVSIYRMGSGEELRRFSLTAHIESTEWNETHRPQTTAVGNTVYVSSGRTLIAVDIEAGVRWRFDPHHPVWLMGIGDGAVYAGSPQTVYAIERQT